MQSASYHFFLFLPLTGCLLCPVCNDKPKAFLKSSREIYSGLNWIGSGVRAVLRSSVLVSLDRLDDIDIIIQQ